MKKESKKSKKERAIKLIALLNDIYDEASCSLNYENALQLLVATQLAAQCTDERVNIVTKNLFVKYKTAKDYAEVDLEVLEQDIKSTGFYRNKAKNIKACCQMLIEKYDGEVPRTMEELTELPGVGRKTANVIMGEIYKQPSIIIDTHAKRLSNRLGLTILKDPDKIEYDLMKILPKENWTQFCHGLVYHGRACCKAIKPRCEECQLKEYCPRLLK